MRDCENGEMRDRLPDLVHGTLPQGARADVEAHLARCEECRREAALLALVRDAYRGPEIDTRRIGSRIPPYVRPTAWRRGLRSPQLRAAAAVFVVAGALSVFALRDRPEPQARRGEVVGPTTMVAVGRGPEELPVGEPINDLTESELNTLIDELDDIDAMTPAESDVELPTLRGGG